VFGVIGSISVDQLGRELGGPPATLRRPLERLLKERRRLVFAAVVDSRGRVLAQAGRTGPPRAPIPAGRLLSDVRRTAAGPLIDYALPFDAPTGKRVLVEGLPLTAVRPFLEDYLQRQPNPEGAALVVADRGGFVVASVAASGAAAPARQALIAAAPIPGTQWRLRLQAERARVLAGAGRGARLGWALLGGLALAILVLQHADGRVEMLNASAKALAETSADFTSSSTMNWLSVGLDGARLAPGDTPSARSFARGTSERRVIGIDRPGHGRLWLDISARPLTRPGEGAPYAVVCSCTDVTERQNLEAHLLDLADRDPLTNLWNRRRFEQDLACQLDRCERYGERAALVMMDVDGFKQVNDVLGHLAGDEVLCALGDALSARLRSSDRAARLGGDEFAVLLLDVDADRAGQIAGDLTEQMRAAAARVRSNAGLSISFGTALVEGGCGGVNAVLEAADRAMSAAKQLRGQEPSELRALRPPIAPTAEMASVRALLAAVNARDSYTAMHSREVVALARGVARQLGLDEAQTSEVEHVAMLHDLGKIAVPDAILRKAGRLTSHEESLMRQHPVVGAVMLSSMPELAHLAPTVRAEHERWTATGTPTGWRGTRSRSPAGSPSCVTPTTR